MYLINRAVAVVTMKEPFLELANSDPDKPNELTLKLINSEKHCYLLPEHDTEQEKEVIIQDLYDSIFKVELHSFCTDPDYWPEDRSYTKFLEWFDIEVHSMLFDPYNGKIQREKFGR